MPTSSKKTRKIQEKLKADVKDTPDLRKRVEDLTEDKTRLQRELDVKTEVADTVEGKKTEEVLSRLSMFRTATYILGASSALLAAAVGYLVMRPSEEHATEQQAADPEPHKIT